MSVKITVPVVRVLAALLADPEWEHYGLGLMQQTGVASGTLYPILAWLQHAGWLASRWEDEDPRVDRGRARGRPGRGVGGQTVMMLWVGLVPAAVGPVVMGKGLNPLTIR